MADGGITAFSYGITTRHPTAGGYVMVGEKGAVEGGVLRGPQTYAKANGPGILGTSYNFAMRLFYRNLAEYAAFRQSLSSAGVSPDESRSHGDDGRAGSHGPQPWLRLRRRCAQAQPGRGRRSRT